MSSTRMPASASASALACGDIVTRSLRAGDLEQLLELHRQHGIAGDPELALEIQLHAGVRIAQHGLEVLVRDFHGALRLAGVALGAARRVGGAVDRPLAATIAGDLEAVDGVQLARL